MDKREAMQHGLGYASGREDGSNVRTVDLPGSTETRMGWYRFAEMYAQAWDDYNHGHRFMMTDARDAYNTWQESNGQTIFRDEMTDVPALQKDLDETYAAMRLAASENRGSAYHTLKEHAREVRQAIYAARNSTKGSVQS